MRRFSIDDFAPHSAMLFGFGALVVIAVLIFNVFHFSAYYGFVQVNYINSLYLVPFVALIFSFGLLLGKKQPSPELDEWIENNPYKLSERERQIVEFMIHGSKNKDIADALFVELSTIKSHINNIYKKVGVKNRAELKQAMFDAGT